MLEEGTIGWYITWVIMVVSIAVLLYSVIGMVIIKYIPGLRKIGFKMMMSKNDVRKSYLSLLDKYEDELVDDNEMPLAIYDTEWELYPDRIKYDKEMISIFAKARVIKDPNNSKEWSNVFSESIGKRPEIYNGNKALIQLLIRNDKDFKKYIK